MIIDCHTHAFPDELAPRAIASLVAKGGIQPFCDGTAKDLIRSLDQNGIDKAVVLSIATKATQETNVNNFAISLLKSDRLIPLGSVFPGSETALSEIERLHKAGVKGIKLHPEYQDFYMEDEIMFPIYEKCAELGMIMHFHCGGDVAYEPPYHASPKVIEYVASTFPDTKIICAHMGGYELWNEFACTVKPHKNLYIDTSMTNTVAKINNKTALKLFEIHGVEKFLFGSDSPWERQCDSLEKLYSYGLSEKETKMILGENAKRLYNL